MKKIFVSMGLAAAGTVGLQAAYTPEGGDSSRLWNVSASLRSFYDDNYATVHTGAKGSFGAELSPTFSLNVPMAQTELGIRYTYGLYYYQERESLGQNPYDQTHQFDLWVDHAFNARWHAKVQDSFVVAQDPALLTPNVVNSAQRANGNNVVNTAKFTLDTDWTRLFSTELGYQNTFYDYENSGATVAGAMGSEAVNPSLAGLLNRVENLVSIDFKWNVQPTTVALVGYQYGQDIYIGNEPIAVFNSSPTTSTVYQSSSRDSLSHYVYLGVNHAFQENLTGNARIGVQYADNYNIPNTTSLGPYVDASLVDTFTSGGTAQIGATHSLNNATSVSQVNPITGRVTQSQDSSVVYGSVNYQVTTKLTASAVGHFEYDTLSGGLNPSDQFYNLGLNLSYAFARHFSTEIGYNFDYYTSAVPGQSYTRDRYYLGLTGSY